MSSHGPGCCALWGSRTRGRCRDRTYSPFRTYSVSNRAADHSLIFQRKLQESNPLHVAVPLFSRQLPTIGVTSMQRCYGRFPDSWMSASLVSAPFSSRHQVFGEWQQLESNQPCTDLQSALAPCLFYCLAAACGLLESVLASACSRCRSREIRTHTGRVLNPVPLPLG